jgi:hypothetical protein
MDTTPAQPPYFYGLQPRWCSDRLYRVYVGPKMLAGAYVAGNIHDEESAVLILQELHFVLKPWVRKLLQARTERELHYDQFDPFGPRFLEHDSLNFQIERTDVLRTTFRRNRVWHRPGSGAVDFVLPAGRKLRLIVKQGQPAEQIEKLLRVFDSGVEVTGQSTPVRTQQPASPRQRSAALWACAVLFLGFAAYFGYAEFVGKGANQEFGRLALMNLAASILNAAAASWIGRRASQKKGEPPAV